MVPLKESAYRGPLAGLNLKKNFATDPKKEKEGIWIDLEDQAKVKIRRFNYAPAQKYLQNKLKPHRKAIELDVFSEDTLNAIFVELLSKFLIVAWENFSYGKDEEGKDLPLECNEKNIALVCRELPELRDLFLSYSRSVEMFKLSEDEADAKN